MPLRRCRRQVVSGLLQPRAEMEMAAARLRPAPRSTSIAI